ncbi:MAG TPA: hypothetical protein VEJ36_05335 [Nitrososphaerales archaeon]|nr:hypothetical protein [Nitrososphaerales archaeon]
MGGRQEYRKYFEEADGVLTKLNLLEISYRTLELHGSRASSDILNAFSKYELDYSLADIADAVKMRFELRREHRDLSYADALGYHLSRKLGLRFLTGDRAFRGLSGIEYVE